MDDEDLIDWASPSFRCTLQSDHVPDVRQFSERTFNDIEPDHKPSSGFKPVQPCTNLNLAHSGSTSDSFDICDSGLCSSSLSTGLEQQIQNIRLSGFSVETTTPNDHESIDSGAESETIALTAKIHEIIETVYQQNDELDTPLHLAVINGDIEAICTIIQQTLVQRCLDIPNNHGQTSLHLSVITGQPAVTRTLLLCGASLGARDNEGRTPLHLACESGDLEMIHCLSEPLNPQEIAVANNLNYHIKWQTIPQAGYLTNFEGEPVLYTAARAGHVDAVQYLVDNCGHDINTQELKSGKTILHLAIESENTTLLGYLLNHEKIDIYKDNFSHKSPLSLARFHPHSLDALCAVYPHLREKSKEMVSDESSDEDDTDQHMVNDL